MSASAACLSYFLLFNSGDIFILDSSDAIQLIILIILIILSGFFSRTETAYTGAGKVRLRSMADDGNQDAARVLGILDDYSGLLSSLLIGNNIVNLSASSLATSLTIKLFGNSMVAVATGIITFAVLMFGEVIPKRQAAAAPEEYALKYSHFIYVYVKLLRPFVYIVEILARGIAFVFRLNVNNAESVITEEELKTYVDVSHEDGAIETDEMELIHNVFDLGDATAKDIMIPRIDMETVDSTADYGEIKEVFRRTMFTRIPVYKDAESPDNMLGFINIKDMWLLDDPAEFRTENILRKAYYTTETKKVTDLLGELRSNRLGVAFVINEYGETVGMITMEDLLEELVGEIRDEYDADEMEQIRKLRDRHYLIEGSVKLDDINDALGTHFDSENYTSLAGIMLEKLDRVPEDNDSVCLEDGTTLKICGMEDHRIKTILLVLPPETEAAKQEDRASEP